ncbi:hypothetical protein Tco_0066744 [Tanacetum coccineum]
MFLGEYECSSLALEREGKDEKKRLDHLKQDQEMLVIKIFSERKKARKANDDETESYEDDIYKYKIRVHKDEDEEMLNVKVDDSDKGDEEVTNAAKTDAKKTTIISTLPPPSVSTIPSVPQQTTTSILTPPITIDAPTITIVVSESNALFAVQLRVSKSEKDVSELKKIDLLVEALAAFKTQVPFVVDNYIGSKVRDVFQKELKKHTADLIQKYYLQQAKKQKMSKFTIKSTDKATLKEYDQKSALYQTMNANKRRRTKESKSSKKPSTTKETLKGKAPSKGSKTGKSILAKEPIKEPIAEVVMDDAGDDMVHDDDQPQDASEPKISKTPNPEWFTQPPRPPTPNPE